MNVDIVLIGPTYPFRGGIAHYTTLLYHELAKHHSARLVSFKRQYPKFLFPGKSDREEGGQLVEIEVDYLLDPLNPWTWWQTAQHIRHLHPKVVIFQWWVPFWAPAWLSLITLLRWQSDAKIVILSHNILPHEARWWDKWLAKSVLGRGDGHIVHAESEKDKLLALLPEVRVVVNPHPTYQVFQQKDLSPAQGRAKLALEPDEAVALFFGFVRPYKGLDILLKAMTQLPDSLALKLLVVGEFWLPETDIRSELEQLGLTEQVTLINKYIGNEEVGLYFSAADVVILPYRHATQSGVAQIAFGFERPVITTTVGGLQEVVAEGQTGFIVPPNDSLSLAQAIEKFFQLEPTEKEKFQQNIRLAAEKFAWPAMVKAIEQVVEIDTLNTA